EPVEPVAGRTGPDGAGCPCQARPGPDLPFAQGAVGIVPEPAVRDRRLGHALAVRPGTGGLRKRFGTTRTPGAAPAATVRRDRQAALALGQVSREPSSELAA